ncbi:MAG: hypothetical protein LQ341_002845 [Variospora aurantia]|nr:MAG: hypothetical protein LQ341_002845 [Variospora aurantia]
MSDSHLNTITKILIMNNKQLSLSKTMRSFLEKCLDGLDIGIEFNNGHHKVRTQQEAIARLQSLRDQGICSLFNSSLKSNAWFRAYMGARPEHRGARPGANVPPTPRYPKHHRVLLGQILFYPVRSSSTSRTAATIMHEEQLADNLKQLNQLMDPDSSPEYGVTTAKSRQTPLAVVASHAMPGQQ